MIRLPSLGMAMRVWHRNARIFAKLWRGALLPPFVDPLFYFVALGFGLGAYVSHVNGVSYADFVAPGLCASAVMWSATFETTFSFYWRMTEARTHENILATPVEVEDLVLGELLWAGTRGAIYGASYLAMIAALGYVHSPAALALLPFLVLGGIVYGAMGMAFSVLVRKMDYLTFYFTLVVNPMFLFGGIFFPLKALPGWAQDVAWFTPTLHLTNIVRALSNDGAAATVIGNTAWLLVAALLIALVPLRRLRGRVAA